MKRSKILAALLLVIGALICTVSVQAYMRRQTDVVENVFVPAKVSCSVEEEFIDGVKRNVKVRNTGNIDAYIRATVIATFVSDDGKVLATAPAEGTDYTVIWAAEGWTKGADGFWYHTKSVKPNETTAPLINSAQMVSAPSGYRLHIQILATGIQSAPDHVVQESWGVSINNGEIIP